MVPRIQFERLKGKIAESRIVLVNGPRRVGKQTLVGNSLAELGEEYMEFDASDKKTRKQFEIVSGTLLVELFKGHRHVVIHEAQYLEKLQDMIEILLSEEINVTLILCCSYQPLIDEVLREVLQLQGLEFTLLPPTFYELAQKNSLPEEEKLLETRLIYGNYPEVTENLAHAELTLHEMIQEVIFTNLGVTDRINKGDKLLRMLQIIAFNIGEPVSYNEIGEKCGLDNETVERYVDLLERSFLLIRIPSFYNGQRYELKKSHVIYFLDNGIRNVLIRNFNPVFLRNDIDQLWRNWLISERIKWNRLNNKTVEYKFWRTHTRQTMDFIELFDGKASAYKTSWEKKKKLKFPALFKSSYPDVAMLTLNRSTYWGFLTKK
ncbi:MAG: ATP-binding protein [Flavobacteriia bacterium]|jgi:predicted AAA+ superfamily ATPase